jgi:hypothetical protein
MKRRTTIEYIPEYDRTGVKRRFMGFREKHEYPDINACTRKTAGTTLAENLLNRMRYKEVQKDGKTVKVMLKPPGKVVRDDR